MAPIVCIMWISLFAYAPAATPPFWRVIEPTMTPIVLVSGCMPPAPMGERIS